MTAEPARPATLEAAGLLNAEVNSLQQARPLTNISIDRPSEPTPITDCPTSLLNRSVSSVPHASIFCTNSLL